MSFSGTPLGQGRRLDHSTFLNKNHLQAKNHSNSRQLNLPTSPQRDIPTSYAYGAPTAGSRSPPKPASATSSQSAPDLNAENEPALVRYARLKREQSLNTQQQGPLQPERWSVKDTSVNIAAAFTQAASTSYGEMPSNNPNNSWASGSQTNLNVPRSTSVEYEKETHSTSTRRLAAPPSRLTQRSRKPLSKQGTGTTHVSDSEGEEPSQSMNQSMRGKSPFEHAVDLSKRVLDHATSIYMRQRSQEPANTSGGTNGTDSSYDYASEEREYQEMQRQQQQAAAQEPEQQPSSRKTGAAHKRGRMSLDNKAYRPSASDLDEDSEDGLSDDGKKRRRKTKKKDLGGGPLTTLPVAGYDKRRKKKTKGSKGNAAEAGDDDESSSGSEQNSSAQRASVTRGSLTRTSVPPPPSRASLPRGSTPSLVPESQWKEVEAGLHPIPETEEPPFVDPLADDEPSFSRSFSLGGFLGRVVHRIVRILLASLALFIRVICLFFLILGRMFGTVVDITIQRPISMISSINPAPFIQIGKIGFTVAVLYFAWYQMHDSVLHWIPARTTPAPYHPPSAPITNLDELTARLQSIESALSGLSLDYQRTRAQQDLEARAQAEVVNRMYVLEARVRDDGKRSAEAETHLKASTGQGLDDVRRELDALHAQLRSVEAAPRETVGPVTTSDDEARARLQTLETRLGGVEGEVKEALELSKSAVKTDHTAPTGGTAWWNKLAAGVGSGSGLTIKSTDGQDVSSLIGHLVDSAVARYGTQDILSRADFALHSAGARVVPSLTTGTLEVRPPTLSGKITGLVTGHGYQVGRSPITALHQELHSGHCWPMTGTEGQLSVALAIPAYITDISIDHLAKEVAFDMSSAPRDMEVWGLVEGKDNLAKLAAWREEKARRRAEEEKAAEEAGIEYVPEAEEEEEYPELLSKSDEYIRLATFTYDIHAPQNIQTFPVSQEIRDLGIDFGLVSLAIKNNWGKDGYTCLYRFRVHGEPLIASPLPTIDDLA
ncbi:hypothetical protein BJ138DRAFT_1062923 [Hygrophoropsis aurantiaca]|uniref:Uncharacterized protein n=1 Tax=Hygrophoropsis aurantiaca TaxID=72124 RepID=A0ACB8AED4_9AGAM|nr:hypothetical protein BJ138DRAFT_1062923 [Hygrophoropsis aurantiaca]